MLSDGGYELAIENIPTPFTVRRFHGTELVNRSGRYEIDLTLPADLVADAGRLLLGVRARLDFGPPESFARRFGGIVDQVVALGTAAQGEAHYRLRLVSRLQTLHHVRRSRIFQEMDTLGIVGAVLAEHGVAHRLAIRQAPSLRTYCVQYRESDLAFVRRLLADEGYFFFFEDPLPIEMDGKLVIADDPTAYLPLLGAQPLVCREGETAMKSEEHHVRDVSLADQIGATRASLRSHDWARPRIPHEARATKDPKALVGFGATEHVLPELPQVGPEIYAHHEDGADSTTRRPNTDPWPRAAVMLEQARRNATILRGTTQCRRLSPGHAFALAEHDLATVNGLYVLSGIETRAVDPKQAKQEDAFVCRFSAVPGTSRLRPKRKRKPLVQVAETAQVVGGTGVGEGDPWVDQWGRVKVRFPWDRDANGSDHDSCWIRVLQPWAGASWGTQFIPRVGMEVLVSFLGGDPDSPVVTGALANTANPPAYPLPESAAVSGIKTRSVPDGGGWNELSFNDTRGAELVVLRAQHDMKLTAEHDLDDTVGGARKVITGGAVTTRSGGLENVVEGDHTLEVHGDDHTQVMGNRTAFVLGNLEADAQNHARLTTGGGAFLSASGCGVVEFKDDTSIRVGSGSNLFTLGAEGMLVLTGSKSISLASLEKIELAVGPNKIVVDAEGIKLLGKVISIGATSEVSVEGPGPKMTLKDEAEIVAKKITIYGEKGDLKLDDKGAELRGEAIKMSKPGTPPEPKKDEEKAETKPLKVKFTDANFEPYADKHYVAISGTQRFEGTTGVDGEIDVQVPKDAKATDVRVWIDEYPTGRTKQWLIQHEELADVGTPKGACQRLKNLGYYDQKIPADDAKDVPPAGASAISWFQKDHELKETGTMDDATKAKLKEVHGE